MKSNAIFTLSLIGGALLILNGCGTNTKIDDSSYRSIGQAAPKPTRKYTSQAATEPTDPVPVPDYPGQSTQVRNNTSQPRQTAGNHVARYGHPGIIDSIVKTAHIHCQHRAYQLSTGDNSFWGKKSGTLEQCTYRFPQHCGAHQFSVLSFGGKTILIYQPPEQTYYVIDTLAGTPKSQPGLWDKDDHLGSNTSNANYLFQDDYNSPYTNANFNPVNLGWIIKASQNDEDEFGKLYHRAVDEITACF